MGNNIDLDCGKITDPDMVVGSSLSLAVTIVASGNNGSPNCYGPNSSMDHGRKHELRR